MGKLKEYYNEQINLEESDDLELEYQYYQFALQEQINYEQYEQEKMAYEEALAAVK